MYRMLLVMLSSAPISHISGTLAHGHRGYNFVMPLPGGFQFIVSQGFGWMLYGVCLAFVVIGAMNQVLASMPTCAHVCTRICTCTRSRAKTRDARQRAYMHTKSDLTRSLRLHVKLPYSKTHTENHTTTFTPIDGQGVRLHPACSSGILPPYHNG